VRGLIEIPAFAALALGVHLALFAGWPGGAPEGAGDSGAAVLSIEGASGAVEAMVAAWETAPARATAAPGLDAPAAVAPAGPAPSAETTPAPGETVAGLPAPQLAEDVPDIVQPAPVPLPVPDVASAPVAPVATPAEAAPALPGASRPDARPSGPPSGLSTPEATPAPVVETASAAPVPATRPKARPEQLARGAGRQGTRGDRAETSAPSLSDSARRSLVASWGAEIRARVEARKVHPAGLRAAGRPVVRITVARSGALEAVQVVRSSRIAALDAAAVSAVRRAGRFPEAPGQLDLARVSFDLPISFTR